MTLALRSFAALALVGAAGCQGGAATAGSSSSATSGSTGAGATGTAGTGGSGGTATSGTGAPAPEPGPDTEVVAFAQEHMYFTADTNRRQVDTQVTFPEAALAYESVTLEVELTCPNDLCDWWDRLAWIGVVRDPGAEDEGVVEVARFITPYRVGASLRFDVTDLRPLLAGPVTLRLFVDTWVGPGHEQGEGWLVDATFVMKGGLPAELPVSAVPGWGRAVFESGNPDNPVEQQMPPVEVARPEGDVFRLRTVLTGHGQGNADNCAEFCPMAHGFRVGDSSVQRLVWRDDCDQTPTQPQQGTWTLPRAGWCPGAEVRPWLEDVTGAVAAEGPTRVEYGIAPYENTCRPGAPVCMGCTLGTGCDYDGGNHTEPRYHLSTILVGYRTLP